MNKTSIVLNIMYNFNLKQKLSPSYYNSPGFWAIKLHKHQSGLHYCFFFSWVWEKGLGFFFWVRIMIWLNLSGTVPHAPQNFDLKQKLSPPYWNSETSTFWSIKVCKCQIGVQHWFGFFGFFGGGRVVFGKGYEWCFTFSSGMIQLTALRVFYFSTF